MFRIVLIVIGLLGVVDTVGVSMVSNFNLGVFLPAILGLPLLILGLFLPAFQSLMNKGFGRVCKWILIVGYALAGVLFAGTSLLLGLTAQQEVEPGADAMIVLGAGIRGETPTLVLSQRLDRAKSYLDESPNTIAILSGGMGEGETVTEASVMKRYLERQGIDSQRLILEERSTSTQENFAFSKEIIQSRWGDQAQVVFVTTEFHVYRAQRVAHMQGLRAEGIAAEDVWYLSPNNYLRECVAIWLYTLRGSI